MRLGRTLASALLVWACAREAQAGYACSAADAAKALQSRLGGQLVETDDGAKITGAVDRVPIELHIRRETECTAKVGVWVDSSKGWNAEARAQKLSAQLRADVERVMSTCSNTQCKSDSAAKRTDEERAGLDKRCRGRFSDALSADKLANASLDTFTDLEKRCLEAAAWGTKNGDAEFAARSTWGAEWAREGRTLADAIRASKQCTESNSLVQVNPDGTVTSNAGSWVLAARRTACQNAVTAWSAVPQTGPTRVEVKGATRQGGAWMVSPDWKPARLSALAGAFGRLLARTEAQEAVAREEAARREAWNRQHCRSFYRCKSDGRSFDRDYRSQPYAGEYGCTTWEYGGMRKDTFEHVRDVCN